MMLELSGRRVDDIHDKTIGVMLKTLEQRFPLCQNDGEILVIFSSLILFLRRETTAFEQHHHLFKCLATNKFLLPPRLSHSPTICNENDDNR